MKLHFWRTADRAPAAPAQESWWPESHSPQTDATRISALMAELAAACQPVQIHLPGVDTPVLARLTAAQAQSLWLKLDGPAPVMPGVPSAVMVSLSLPTAVVMFGLTLSRCADAQRLRAPMPRELLRVQSRAYRRVHCPPGLLRSVRLHLDGLTGGAASPELDDLSEGGAGACSPADTGPELGWQGQGSLTWGQVALPLPAMTVVHRRVLASGACRLGLQFNVMPGRIRSHAPALAEPARDRGCAHRRHSLTMSTGVHR